MDFYVAEIPQRDFYGFWDHGDVMHTYDTTRHIWRYDVGGYAWDNGELGQLNVPIHNLYNIRLTLLIGTDLWLWISFLRTGRADVWRIAHAMTRHLSEVDTHHTGSFAGIGSRHNVSHWGDGAKEARVAGSWLRRPFYYLTSKSDLLYVREHGLLSGVFSGRVDGRYHGLHFASRSNYYDLGSTEESVTSR